MKKQKRWAFTKFDPSPPLWGAKWPYTTIVQGKRVYYRALAEVITIRVEAFTKLKVAPSHEELHGLILKGERISSSAQTVVGTFQVGLYKA